MVDSAVMATWLTAAPPVESPVERLREGEAAETFPPVDTALPIGVGPLVAPASEANVEPSPRPLLLEWPKLGAGSASLASVLPPLELTVVSANDALLRCAAGFDDGSPPADGDDESSPVDEGDDSSPADDDEESEVLDAFESAPLEEEPSA